MSGAARRRVLVLDDDPGILSLIAENLRGEPVHLVECTELEAAEALLNHLQFEVLVADLEVSELGGLEGMRVIRHVVTNFPETKVLVFSGHVTSQAQRLAGGLGVTEFFEKPGDLGRLVTLVRRLTTDPFSTVVADDGLQVTVIEPLEEIISEKRVSSLFQPIVRLSRNGSPRELFGVEALSRGPSESLVSNPLILFDYSVRKELVFQIDMLCMESALIASRGMPSHARLFINSHPRAMSHPDFVKALDDLLETHHGRSDRVVLEVTEHSAIVDATALAEVLHPARQKGVQVALDDFGEGSSNLHLVHDLKPDFLKITGRFSDNIETTPVKQALVKSAVGLGRDLGMTIVMERVETDQQLRTLATLGIQYGQGYHLGRPQRLQEIFAAEPRDRRRAAID